MCPRLTATPVSGNNFTTASAAVATTAMPLRITALLRPIKNGPHSGPYKLQMLPLRKWV